MRKTLAPELVADCDRSGVEISTWIIDFTMDATRVRGYH